MSIPVVRIVGKTGAGKTTLLEKILAELKKRRYKVATIKHHAQVGFNIEVPGKDTRRVARAGSDYVMIASPDMIALYNRLENEPGIEEILPTITGVDIILTEGYRKASLPGIEVVRSGHHHELVSDPEALIAIASDIQFDIPVPHFLLDDASGIVDLICHRYLNGESTATSEEN